MAETSQPSGKKKRVVGSEADQLELSAKRFQAALSDENTPSVVAGADVQPRQQQ